ncbi:MAG TPA: potassium channel family protein [Xanthobacteraceae bacterium]|nr:potassium channel family protein [Xanthobacteraceae bacterium]
MRSSMMSLKKSWIHFLKLQERSREPGLSVLMFIEGTLIFVIIPLASVGLMPGFVLAAMFILLVLATLVVTSRSRWAAGVVAIAVLLSPVGAFVHAEHPTVFTESLNLGARLLALSALSVVIARAVFGPGRVTWHRVQGAIVLYMNFALFFFTLYRFLNTLVPDAFHGLPQSGAEHGSGAALLYFSFSTLTTVGYGDITPVYPLARNLANLEAVIGQLFPATLLARLVSLEIEHRRQSKSG